MKLKVFIITGLLLCAYVTSQAGESASAPWGYKGALGPEYWGTLSKGYRHCSKGKNQSPINISWAAELELDKIEFHYNSTPVFLINNGHTIQLNHASGSYIVIAGDRFDLLQLHFHTLSEHQVKGRHYPMEMHLVHQDRNKRLAVIGVFFKAGRQNKSLKKLWEKLPTRKGASVSGDAVLNVTSLLPDQRSYFHYMGSLTTPPCSEGVRWLVLKNPVQVSKKQLNAFKKLFPANYRPVMPLNSRNIYSMN